MFEWTTGFATRSKNLDSLCLDKIVYMMMVQRSRPVILFGAAVLAIAVPIVLGWTTLGDGCARLSTSCPKDSDSVRSWLLLRFRAPVITSPPISGGSCLRFSKERST